MFTMFRRKLLALNHAEASTYTLTSDRDFRNLVLWLEDQKIRFYKIEDRSELRNTDNPKWDVAYRKYLLDLQCPIKSGIREEELEWLLSQSVRLTFENEQVPDESPKSSSSSNLHPLISLDLQSQQYKDGVNRLAKLFAITPQKDHLMTLKGVSKIITTRLSELAIKNPDSIVPKGEPFPLQEVDSGFDYRDPILNEAAKILRLLFIQDLRQLQTSINECIVRLQNITANPKTDTKLGQVGK